MEPQRHATRPRPQVRCTFSVAGAWRHAVGPHLARTLGIPNTPHASHQGASSFRCPRPRSLSFPLRPHPTQGRTPGQSGALVAAPQTANHPRKSVRQVRRHLASSRLTVPTPVAGGGKHQIQVRQILPARIPVCLTPRSSGAPTACHQAPATGSVYIFRGRGLASCRRAPLSSNVRRHKTHAPDSVPHRWWPYATKH